MDEVPLLILLLVLSGFFSGAEIALFSLGSEKIHALKQNTNSKKKLRQIERLERLKSDPSKLLVTILIGNNVVNVAASALATLMGTNIAYHRGYGEETALIIGVVTGVMTFLLLLFGEITPKALAHKHAVRFSLLVTPVLSFLQFLLFPIVSPLSKLVAKFSGHTELKHGLSEDELKAAIELSEREGEIETAEKEMVEKVLEFNEHSVDSIMTPRSKIFALEDDTPVLEALKKNSENKFSRIPIYHEELDQVIGILTIHAIADGLAEKEVKSKKVANLRLLKPMKIPVTMKIDTLLHEFQTQKSHLALVLDEHGGTVGLITMEDVLEEIFGEIQDEQDESEAPIRRIGKRKFFCAADVELEQIEEFLKEELDNEAPERFPWDLEAENKSLGYLILEKLEYFPTTGEKIEIKAHDGTRFIFLVKKAENEKIEAVELTVIPAEN